MHESDAAYFHRRAQEERAYAETLGSPRTRSLHLDLADRYDSLASAINQPPG